MGRRRRVWKLSELDVQWREGPPDRYQVGFSFLCPMHGSHRLRVRLSNPGDGYPEEPWSMSVAADRNGRNVGDLTLTTPAGLSELDFGPCGLWRIIDGRVTPVR